MCSSDPVVNSQPIRASTTHGPGTGALYPSSSSGTGLRSAQLGPQPPPTRYGSYGDYFRAEPLPFQYPGSQDYGYPPTYPTPAPMSPWAPNQDKPYSVSNPYQGPFLGEGAEKIPASWRPNYSGSPGQAPIGGASNAYNPDHFSPFKGESDPWSTGYLAWGSTGPFTGPATALPWYGSGPDSTHAGLPPNRCTTQDYYCEYWNDERPVCSQGVSYRNRCEAKCYGVVGYADLPPGVCGQAQASYVAESQYYYNPAQVGDYFGGVDPGLGANVWETDWDHAGIFGPTFDPHSPASGNSGNWYNGGLFSPRAPYDLNHGPFW